MPPKKRPVSTSAKKSAEKKSSPDHSSSPSPSPSHSPSLSSSSSPKLKKSGYILVIVNHCGVGEYSLYNIPVIRLGPGVVEEFLEAEARAQPLDIIPSDESPTCLRKLGIRLDCYQYDSHFDPEELKDVTPDLVNCKFGKGAQADDPDPDAYLNNYPGTYLHVSPVFALVTQDWR